MFYKNSILVLLANAFNTLVLFSIEFLFFLDENIYLCTSYLGENRFIAQTLHDNILYKNN